jgi:hypothetical protein
LKGGGNKFKTLGFNEHPQGKNNARLNLLRSIRNYKLNVTPPDLPKGKEEDRFEGGWQL